MRDACGRTAMNTRQQPNRIGRQPNPGENKVQEGNQQAQGDGQAEDQIVLAQDTRKPTAKENVADTIPDTESQGITERFLVFWEWKLCICCRRNNTQFSFCRCFLRTARDIIIFLIGHFLKEQVKGLLGLLIKFIFISLVILLMIWLTAGIHSLISWFYGGWCSGIVTYGSYICEGIRTALGVLTRVTESVYSLLHTAFKD